MGTNNEPNPEPQEQQPAGDTNPSQSDSSDSGKTPSADFDFGGYTKSGFPTVPTEPKE